MTFQNAFVDGWKCDVVKCVSQWIAAFSTYQFGSLEDTTLDRTNVVIARLMVLWYVPPIWFSSLNKIMCLKSLYLDPSHSSSHIRHFNVPGHLTNPAWAQ